MGSRRALLIGASEYGDGFSPLPAVSTDVELVETALTSRGYEASVVARDIAGSANALINAIEEFCGRCRDDDVHVIYFSGHGMLLGNEDCIIPAGADRDRVTRRKDLRVPTDLSAALPREHGLIVFVIDACRSIEHQPTTKGGSAWGDDGRISAPSDQRFIRFFGCSPGEVCHVLTEGPQGRPVSVFSKALTDVLADGETTTLKECLLRVQDQCQQIAAAAHLEIQTPRLSHGETSADTDRILGAPIFSREAAASLPAIWGTFDPDKLHCLIVASEYETTTPPSWTLDDLVAAAVINVGHRPADPNRTSRDANPRMWNAFRDCWNGVELVSGATRTLPERFDAACVRQVTVPVTAALASPAALREAVRGVIEADLVVFDVTGFEPGVMLLVGVRAACRRGVTLCSHGGRWREGLPLEVPFNLQDLNIGSHTPREQGPGENPVVERFVQRVVAGFTQLKQRPRYLDLPAYDALRQLGADMAASALIQTSDKVLVMCPYDKEFFSNWEAVVQGLSTALSDGHNLRPDIVRVIDLATPQVVSQAIYEQARRVAACVVDWTDYSPSVFVELGVRQAVSEWGAVSIIDQSFKGGAEATARRDLKHVGQLDRLFAPLKYSLKTKRTDFAGVASALVNQNLDEAAHQPLSIIHDVAWRAVATVTTTLPPVFEELSAAADALSHADQGQVQKAQILFHESSVLKLNSEDAAIERRVSAWLYLHKRVNAAALPERDPRRKRYFELGEAAAAGLYAQSERDRPDSLDLALYIEDEMNRARTPGSGT